MSMKSSFLRMAYTFAMLASTNNEYSRLVSNEKEQPIKDTYPVIPNGCKLYIFDASGNCQVEWNDNGVRKKNDVTIPEYEAYFNCIASSYKKAKEKFDKYMLQGS
jgi:hypothetical protein